MKGSSRIPPLRVKKTALVSGFTFASLMTSSLNVSRWNNDGCTHRKSELLFANAGGEPYLTTLQSHPKLASTLEPGWQAPDKDYMDFEKERVFRRG